MSNATWILVIKFRVPSSTFNGQHWVADDNIRPYLPIITWRQVSFWIEYNLSVCFLLIWQRSPRPWNWAQSQRPSSWHQPPLRHPQYSTTQTNTKGYINMKHKMIGQALMVNSSSVFVVTYLWFSFAWQSKQPKESYKHIFLLFTVKLWGLLLKASNCFNWT